MRILIYGLAFILAYALSCGPALFYYRRMLANGWRFAPLLQAYYGPGISVGMRIPLYRDYIRWWMEVSD